MKIQWIFWSFKIHFWIEEARQEIHWKRLWPGSGRQSREPEPLVFILPAPALTPAHRKNPRLLALGSRHRLRLHNTAKNRQKRRAGQRQSAPCSIIVGLIKSYDASMFKNSTRCELEKMGSQMVVSSLFWISVRKNAFLILPTDPYKPNVPFRKCFVPEK
jgi:hypothetical protein